MEQALVADGGAIPAGSGEFERRPMRLAATDPVTDSTGPVAPTVQPAPTDPPPGS
jgi:hypothetical protein